MTTSSQFGAALALVLKSEGGRVDNPADPGGRTNAGITAAVYNAWRATKGLPKRDVYLASADEVAAIYHDQYAAPIRFDDLPAGLGYAAFDAGVMSGPSRAAKWLQTAVGTEPDGHVGVLTIAAAKKCDVAKAINAVCDERMGFLRGISAWPTFAKGWTNRVEFVRKSALGMVGKTAPSIPSPGPIVTLPPVITPSPNPKLGFWARLFGRSV